ncbi:hypothetical protein EOM39_02530 [Candidatus Gracilibacteria bacterium]|nr:hypothetical protein [Candidatus Gracilibacteria bacterium]
MKTIYFCSTNNGKKIKLQKDISQYSKNILLEIVDFEINEIQDINCENVSKNKVIEVYKKINKPCIAMDSGLYISSLNNFPGSYVKMTLETIGIIGIMELIKNKSDKQFEIRNCLSYYDGENLKQFTEVINGNISNEIYPLINNDYAWSDLYKIIIPNGYNITLAEMTNDIYLEWDKKRIINGMTKQFIEWFEK